MTDQIIISTRNQDSQVETDLTLYQAIKSFMSSEGYRLDFQLEDGSSLYIYRSDEQQNDGKFDHPAFSIYQQFPAKILMYNKHSIELPDNIIDIAQHQNNKSLSKEI